jgi:glutaredoxin-like YruB-family protein
LFLKSQLNGSGERKMEDTSRRENKVVVYTTPNCPYCVLTKRYLTQQNVRFEEKDVSRDVEAAQEMIFISRQTGTPVTKINGNVIIGFDPPRLNYFLGIPTPTPQPSAAAQGK